MAGNVRQRDVIFLTPSNDSDRSSVNLDLLVLHLLTKPQILASTAIGPFRTLASYRPMFCKGEQFYRQLRGVAWNSSQIVMSLVIWSSGTRLNHSHYTTQ